MSSVLAEAADLDGDDWAPPPPSNPAEEFARLTARQVAELRPPGSTGASGSAGADSAGGAGAAGAVKGDMPEIVPCESALKVVTFTRSFEGLGAWAFQIVHMADSFHVWVGEGRSSSSGSDGGPVAGPPSAAAPAPPLGDLIAAMPGRFSIPVSTSALVRGAGDEFALACSKRLAKKLGKVLYVSCSAPVDSAVEAYLEKTILTALQDPESAQSGTGGVAGAASAAGAALESLDLGLSDDDADEDGESKRS
eukprot:g6598.t1